MGHEIANQNEWRDVFENAGKWFEFVTALQKAMGFIEKHPPSPALLVTTADAMRRICVLDGDRRREVLIASLDEVGTDGVEVLVTVAMVPYGHAYIGGSW